jgi:hypothetical protein
MRTPPSVLPDQDEVPAYKSTWLDRVGGSAEMKLKAIGYGIMVTGITIAASMLVLSIGGVRMTLMFFAMLGLAAIIAGSLVALAGVGFATASGRAIKAFTLPSGNSTPYQEQFSYQEAMIARGDMAGALESFEAVIAERPDAVLPRLRAAEHYAARQHKPKRAAELFTEVRKISGISTRDFIYATSRLIDLYDGPLNEPGRALVEMRRVIELYPDSAVAFHAREALPGLKARLHKD